MIKDWVVLPDALPLQSNPATSDLSIQMTSIKWSEQNDFFWDGVKFLCQMSEWNLISFVGLLAFV